MAVGDAVKGIEDPAAILAAVQNAARSALDDFRGKPARQGRALIFAERSVSLDDSGMVAFTRMIEGLRG